MYQMSNEHRSTWTYFCCLDFLKEMSFRFLRLICVLNAFLHPQHWTWNLGIKLNVLEVGFFVCKCSTVSSFCHDRLVHDYVYFCQNVCSFYPFWGFKSCTCSKWVVFMMSWVTQYVCKQPVLLINFPVKVMKKLLTSNTYV